MNLLIVLSVLLAILFAISFITKRRFGVLGLALAAGAVLSGIWTPAVTPYAYSLGIELQSLPLEMVVAVVITLTPAFLLLLSGPSYTNKSGRVVGSLLFSVLACAFLIESMGNYLVPTAQVQSVYSLIEANRSYIVSFGLIASVVDLVLTKTHKPPKPSAKH